MGRISEFTPSRKGLVGKMYRGEFGAEAVLEPAAFWAGEVRLPLLPGGAGQTPRTGGPGAAQRIAEGGRVGRLPEIRRRFPTEVGSRPVCLGGSRHPPVRRQRSGRCPQCRQQGKHCHPISHSVRSLHRLGLGFGTKGKKFFPLPSPCGRKAPPCGRFSFGRMPFLWPGPCRCDRFRSGGCLIGCFFLYLSSGRQLLSGIVRSARRHPPGSGRSRISCRSCNCVANNNFIHMRSILRSLVAAACLSFPGLAAAQSLPGADSSAVAAYRPQFSTAGFYELPGTGRTVYNMNPAWRFHRGAAEGAGQRDFDDRAWPLVSLPDGIEYLPTEASGCVNYQGEVWYRKHFTPREEWRGKRLFLHFEAIMGKSEVWVNGHCLARHYGGYLPVVVDISPAVEYGGDNVIAVRADNSDDPTFPPGKPQDALDFAYFGGIYRDCWLIAHNRVFITDPNYEDQEAGGGLFVSYDDVSEASARVRMAAHVRNLSGRSFRGRVVYDSTTGRDSWPPRPKSGSR